MTEETRKELLEALQEAIMNVYQVEHRYNHQFMYAEVKQAWPLPLDRETAIRDRAALSRAMTLLTMKLLPALESPAGSQ